MAYVMVIAAMTLVILLVNTFLMQEQEQITSAVADGIAHHIDIAPFKEWCTTHEPSGYWDSDLVAYKVAESIITGHGLPIPNYATEDPTSWDGYPDPETTLAVEYYAAKVNGLNIFDAVDAIEERKVAYKLLAGEEEDLLWMMGDLSDKYWEEVDELLGIEYPPAEPWPYPEVEPEDLPF